ncbi:MAG: 4-hydroxybutyrate CoA-transferase [Alistipes sp.]|jgi:4-hydroxybutyrate CoA-transferase|nr:4-hydroxybutyrate CoA-transferase [Alistipes sp.]
MNWQQQFDGKIITAAEAVGKIEDGVTVVCSHAATNPQVIMRELVAQKERYTNLRLFHVMPLGYGEYASIENSAHFRHVTTFAGGTTRKAVAEGRADFIPCFFKNVPALLGNEIPVDIAVINVSTPDEDGYCSFSLSSDYTVRATELAKVVIAQVNDALPRVGGRDNSVHISRFDWIVPCSDPAPELPTGGAPSELEASIARHCASLVNDGDTLQLGIGAIPDAVLGFLTDKKHLGLHTEILCDGAVDMIKSGVIDGSRKTLHPGKVVVTFLAGTPKLYDFVADNPDIVMLPVDYVNDPATIAKHDNMVSINSCVEVDLTGQVNSETIGGRQFSGLGGQVDFVRGAQMSRGGKSIITMSSTASGGKISRIVPQLSPGNVVTTSRGDVDYIVTEYGIAKLKGKTLRERAQALIAIAHPDFRAGLEEEFGRRFY